MNRRAEPTTKSEPVLLQRLGHLRERAGRDGVVGVDERQELAARVLDPEVAGDALPGVGLLEERDAAVVLGDPVNDVAGAVGRTVVDHDDLEVVQRRGQQAVEALPDVGLDVVGRHDHAQGRRVPAQCATLCRAAHPSAGVLDGPGET